jgi:hypothetical protein
LCFKSMCRSSPWSLCSLESRQCPGGLHYHSGGKPKSGFSGAPPPKALVKFCEHLLIRHSMRNCPRRAAFRQNPQRTRSLGLLPARMPQRCNQRSARLHLYFAENVLNRRSHARGRPFRIGHQTQCEWSADVARHLEAEASGPEVAVLKVRPEIPMITLGLRLAKHESSGTVHHRGGGS